MEKTAFIVGTFPEGGVPLHNETLAFQNPSLLAKKGLTVIKEMNTILT